MTTESVKIAKINKSEKVSGMALEASGKFIGGVKDLAIAALQNPMIAMVAAAALIEYLQTVYIKDYVVLHPGTGIESLMETKRPFISQPLATTLETVIFTTEGLNALGNGLSGILSILKPGATQ